MKTTLAGRINKLFGTGGGVMLTLYPAFPDDFSTDEPLFVLIDALEVPLWCERFERRGIAGAVATFADFDTERRAGELVGLEFRIGQHAEDEDEEFRLEELIGFAVEVRESEGRKLGATLTDFYDSEVNPLFELEADGRRILVPAAEEFIAGIDFERRTMKLIVPEGLLDL